jgi:hypothetical protein
MNHNIHSKSQHDNLNDGENQRSVYNGNNQTGCNGQKTEPISSRSECDTESGARRVPLMCRKQVVGHALVDAADYDRLAAFRWGVIRVHRTSYAIRYAWDGKRVTAILMHRDVLGVEGGRKNQVDHIDFDGLNNRRSNLRIVSHAENCQHNRPSVRNTTGHVGVSFDSERGKWHARLTRNGRRIHHSMHRTMEGAVAARAAAAQAVSP